MLLSHSSTTSPSSAKTSARQDHPSPPPSADSPMRATFKSTSSTPVREVTTPRPDKVHEHKVSPRKSPPVIYESSAQPPRLFAEAPASPSSALDIGGEYYKCQSPVSRCSSFSRVERAHVAPSYFGVYCLVRVDSVGGDFWRVREEYFFIRGSSCDRMGLVRQGVCLYSASASGNA